MKRINANRKTARGGMTLVIVLGFVAVISILAISLLITMRVERLATNSFAETVRARQMIHTALARAMNAINGDMEGREVLYPAEIYTLPTGSGTVANAFQTLDSRLYVPADLTNLLPSTVWLENVMVGTNVIGRVGYLAVDMSGLIDVNIASKLQRSRGLSGAEIRISPSLHAEVRNLGNLVDQRSNNWRRIESNAELLYLGGESGALFTNAPTRNFAAFSRFGPDYTTSGQPKKSLAGDAVALLARRAEIIAAFAACNIPNPEMVFTNLLDYVDTDSIPRNLEGFTTEAVPMINEVIFSNSVTRTSGGGVTVTTHRVYMTVETWFPFGDRTFADSSLVAESSPIFSVLTVQPAELAIDPIADLQTTGPRPVAAHPPNSFQQTTFVWEKRTNAPIVVNTALIRLQMNSELRVEQGGSRLDLARFPNSSIDLQTPIPPNTGPIRIRSFSVVDPRLNHVASEWALQAEQPAPTYTAITPGRMNQNAVGGEGASSMHVRDFPLDLSKPGVGIGTVGELGFLSVGQPWRTIALYNTPGVNLHPVLDHFTIVDPPVRRALLNINSANASALAGAFYSMPVEAYPGGGGPTVTIAAARTLASNLITRLAPTRFETNRALSVLGEFDTGLLTALNGQLISPVLTNDALRESIIRNSSGLFSYRQNLFNVYLFSQSITPGGSTGAEARAVATIWRDPELDDPSNTTNKMMLRFFRWL
ncbi:MAG TPA: hypothetical protein PKE12_13845 [Kiritimatiellia bacterium]|nr:hypothetical protein [Kiritimatiellia bacterium]